MSVTAIESQCASSKRRSNKVSCAGLQPIKECPSKMTAKPHDDMKKLMTRAGCTLREVREAHTSYYE
eukprot:695237-Amphidinium_carterae.1